MLSPLLVFVAALLAAPPSPSSGAPEAPSPAPAPHIALAAGLFASAGLVALIKPSAVGPQPRCSLTAAGLCNPQGLLALDRGLLGRHNVAWRRASDTGEILGIAAPAATLLALSLFTQPQADTTLQPAWDLLLWTETMAVSAFIDQGLKLALQRPRPIWYAEAAHGAEAQVSFPSGHSLATAAGTTALTTLFWQRYPHSPWRWVVMSAGGRIVGAHRLGARRKQASTLSRNVVAGWVIGATLGYVYPTLAAHNLHLEVQRGEDARAALVVRGGF